MKKQSEVRKRNGGGHFAIAFISLLAAIAIGACAPGGGGMSGANPDDRTQEVWTDEGTNATEPGNLPGGGGYGMDGTPGTGADDVAGPPTGGGLAGGGGYGMDGGQGTERGDDTGAPGSGMLPKQGPGEIARGTDIGNPNPDESAGIPVKEWSLCFQRNGFLLTSDTAMGIRQLFTREARQEAFVLTPPLGEGVVSVTFFFPLFNRMLLLLPPRDRLRYWVKGTMGLDLAFVPGPIPTMAGMVDDNRVVAATHNGSSFVLLRGDPDLVDTIQITSERVMQQQGRSIPARCTDGEADVELLKDPPPEGQTEMTIMKGLRDATKGRTMQLLAPQKK